MMLVDELMTPMWLHEVTVARSYQQSRWMERFPAGCVPTQKGLKDDLMTVNNKELVDGHR
jgi:hypothetical protein